MLSLCSSPLSANPALDGFRYPGKLVPTNPLYYISVSQTPWVENSLYAYLLVRPRAQEVTDSKTHGDRYHTQLAATEIVHPPSSVCLVVTGTIYLRGAHRCAHNDAALHHNTI